LKELVIKPTLFIGILSGFFTLLYIFFISLILSILTILFFSRQKKNIKNYYIITVIYFILSSLGANFERYFDILWIKYTFGTLTIAFFIVLTYFNKWVIYLKKKEKIKVIGLSNVLFIVVIISLTQSGSKEQLEELIGLFSSSVITAYHLILGMATVYAIFILILTIFQLPATEVIERKTSEIESLQNLSQVISKVQDIDELVSFIIKTIEQITGSKFIQICLMDEKGYCKFYSNNDESRELFKKFNEAFLLKLQELVNEKNLEINITTIPNELNPTLEKITAIPLFYNQILIGYILIGKDKNSAIDEIDFNTLKSIGEYSVIAIQNYRLLQKSIEKERLEKELEVAREVQKKLIPEQPPINEKLEIAFTFIPAFEVGGDYIDYFQIDKNKFGFIIADVSGKGISAAFYMAEVKGIFESLSKILVHPKDILIQANKILCKSLDKKSFVSVVYSTIDMETGLVKIARAGHCPILFLRNSKFIELIPSGIAIGLDQSQLFDQSIEEISFKLEKNDLLLFYTDGVTEARNQFLEEFGKDRLNEIVKNSFNQSSQSIIQKIVEELTVFSKDYPQHDDITLLAIKFSGDKNE
jgi:serine phosphatase RsbU (regulator of sigma subunit)